MHVVITGANGFLGRHLVASCLAQGWIVTAIVRSESARASLPPGVHCEICDLAEIPLPMQILSGVDVVIHAAAAVRDWAPWEYFYRNNVRATEKLCAAMSAAGCHRLIHISTVAVYGQPRSNTIVTENQPARRIHKWNYYRRSKRLAEQCVWEAHRGGKLSATVLRPAMVYGPGDHTFLGRIIPLLRQRKMLMLGNPETLLPLVHVRDVAAAALLSAASNSARGEAFNIVNDEPVTQRDLLNAVAGCLTVPPVQSSLPYSMAYAAGFLGEIAGHMFRLKEAPRLTRYPVFLFGRQRQYSTAKAQTVLKWKPAISFRNGLPEAVASFLDTRLSSPCP